MKIPLSWISLYSPLQGLLDTYDTKKLAHLYSIHTAEIDTIEGHSIDKVVVGKVISCVKHPESKKLSIVQVDLGQHGQETILTGAENIIDATYVAVAIVGAILPGDFIIGERMMAGMMSRGMICGADEIGMSSIPSTGIMILEEEWDKGVLESRIGTSFFDLTLTFPGRGGTPSEYRLQDTVFEIDNKFITNRPDLFSIVGNAREFATVFDGTLEPYTHTKLIAQGKLTPKIESKKVLSYTLIEMSGLSIKSSPWGVSLMMERAGLTLKSDIVDITNLIMTELGQPMHVFDKEKIVGNISVRMARPGETMMALNTIEYTLTEEDLVIADDAGPIALAGIIGGSRTAVGESTTHVLWESACFDATTIRLSSQRHGIRTDSSTRYEKSLDPTLAGTVGTRICEYMQYFGKTYTIEALSEFIDETQVRHIELSFATDFIREKSGISIETSTITTILENLGFSVRVDGDILSVTVPSWRSTKDISIKEDIAEEIMRVIGYDSITPTPLPTGKPIIISNPETELRDITLAHFRDAGWHEVYTYSFSSASLEQKILRQDMDDAIAIRNAFNEEYTHMRRSLAPRLLLATEENKKYESGFGFFEIGNVYSKNEYTNENPSLMQTLAKRPFSEKKMLSGIITGSTLAPLRHTLESYLMKIAGYIPPIHSVSSISSLHPGRSGSYSEGETSIVRFGALHPEVITTFGLSDDTYYFEADFDILLTHFQNRERRFVSFSRYQIIPRELNFILDAKTPTGDIARMIDAIHPWIQHVRVASIYEDAEKVGSNKKSVNFSFILSNPAATISDTEAMEVQNKIVDTMNTRGYQLRTL